MLSKETKERLDKSDHIKIIMDFERFSPMFYEGNDQQIIEETEITYSNPIYQEILENNRKFAREANHQNVSANSNEQDKWKERRSDHINDHITNDAEETENNHKRNSEQHLSNESKKTKTTHFEHCLSMKDIHEIKKISVSSSFSSHKIIRETALLGTLTETSNILSQENFEKLVHKLPILYKLFNWKRAYSARRDGSAFNTFLKKTKDIRPGILLIEESKGNILGAFLVDSIEAGKTGRGEMFIFAFKGKERKLEVYPWTSKNDFFVYLETDKGIGIGMGTQYGIFMNRNLEKGSSASTHTFGNTERLSNKEDFYIDEVEVLGPDNFM